LLRIKALGTLLDLGYRAVRREAHVDELFTVGSHGRYLSVRSVGAKILQGDHAGDASEIIMR